MAPNRVQSHDVTINDLFKNSYVVPDYQREYVWEDHEVAQLLQDVYTEFTNSPLSDMSEYFLGSIVVCPREDGAFELIDGQQRITTLYLILCAIRDHNIRTSSQPIQGILPLLTEVTTSPRGEDIRRYRVSLQYEDSADVLDSYADPNHGMPDDELSTRSARNLANTYNIALAFIEDNFPDHTDDALRRFFGYLVHSIKLIRITTTSVAQALKIFETINERGRGLDSMDLLKNLMFMQASDQEFESLRQMWKELVDLLYQSNERPLRFLRYHILANFDVDRLPEDQIYDWFASASEDSTRSPTEFVADLLDAARCYFHFLNGRDSTGTLSPHLDNIRHLNRAMRQHLILLLAARTLPPPLFNHLCYHVENLFFTLVIIREPMRAIEQRISQWASELRAVDGAEALDDFINRRVLPAQKTYANRFILAFHDLAETTIPRYRMRYVLAKIAQNVDSRAAGEQLPLDRYLRAGIHLEHILPVTPPAVGRIEFDEPDRYEEYVHRLGNLTLVERSINTSLGNRSFCEKRELYTDSTILLTKSIATSRPVGKNTAINRAMNNLITFETWTSESIDTRQGMLTQLALAVWNVPHDGIPSNRTI